jgi:ribosome biogenesis GTPase A
MNSTITMTPWEELSQRYIREIKSAAHLYQKTRHLKGRLSTAEVGEIGAEIDRLADSMASLNRTRRRLEQGEFRIAVVGLEKAGKSTFVNAWLGHDLLPSDTQRCTFTTTQLFSVLKPREQRLVVHTKSPEEFQSYIEELSKATEDESDAGRRAREDLNTIEAHRASLDEVISVGERVIP